MTDDKQLTTHEFALAFEEFYGAYRRFETLCRGEVGMARGDPVKRQEALDALRLGIVTYGGIPPEQVVLSMALVGQTIQVISTSLALKWGVMPKAH